MKRPMISSIPSSFKVLVTLSFWMILSMMWVNTSFEAAQVKVVGGTYIVKEKTRKKEEA
jgi:hypothetical protein